MFNDFKLAITIPFLVIKTLKVILFTPKLLFLTSLPGMLGFVIFAILSYFSVANKTWIYSLTGLDFNSWYADAASWLLALVSVFISAVLALLIVNIILGFVIEILIENFTFKANIIREGLIELPWYKSFLKIAINETILLLIFTILTLLALLLSFIPPLALLGFILSTIVGGYSLCNLVLVINQDSLRNRIHYPIKWPMTCFVIGLLFSSLLVIPFIGMLFIPILYCTAVLIVAKTRA
jgi:hypothetical protein